MLFCCPVTWDRVKHQRILFTNGCTDFVSYQDTALAEYSCSNHLDNPDSVLLYKSCPTSYRGPAMSSDAPMKYVSPGLRDLYRILPFQGHFGKVIYLVLYWLVT